MDWKKFMCSFLGMPEESEDEAIKAGFNEKVGALCVEAANVGIAALEKRVVETEAKIALTALSADVGTLKTEITALSAGIAERDRQDLVRQAAFEGKVIPLSADQVKETDLATLRDMVGKLPVTVPLDQRTPDKISALSVEGSEATALERVAKACGLDPKKVATQNS